MTLTSHSSYQRVDTAFADQVPAHWRATALKFLGEYLNGYPFKPEDWSEDGLPIIRISQLTGGAEPNCFLGDLDERFKVSQGDLLFSWSASIDAYIWEGGDAWLNQHIFKVRPSPEATKRYLYYLIKQVAPKLAEFDAHGSTMRHIKKESLGERVFVPDPTEQEAIAAFLDRETARIDALIEKKTRFIDLLREKRQALITQAVTRGLNPSVRMSESGVEWLGAVPAAWDVVQLRHVAKLGSGHTPSRERPDWWQDCYIPWFTLADVWQVRRERRKFVHDTEEMISDLGIANSSAALHPAGSVMLSRTASVGFPAIMGRDMATSQDFAVWTCGPRLFNEYLYCVLLGMDREFARVRMGSTHKTIYMPDIEAFRIPLPPIEEQRAIVRFLDDRLGRFDELVAATERSIELLKERRAALITAAVTGQIDLREAA